MQIEGLNVNFTDVEEWSPSRGPLPEGFYILAIESVEVREGRSSGKPYLSFKYVVTDGEHRERVVYDNFSLWAENNGPALSRYKSLRKVCGLNPNIPGSTEDFPGRVFRAKIRIRENKYTDSRENYISAYYPSEMPKATGAAPGMMKQAPAQAAPAETGFPWVN